jgi:hypothetical protein
VSGAVPRRSLRSSRWPRRSLTSTAGALALAVVAAACGGGEAGEASDSGSATTTATSPTTATTSADDTSLDAATLSIELSAREVVAAAPAGVTCAAVGDEVALLRAALGAEGPAITAVRAQFRTPEGRSMTVAFEPGADGVPTAEIGPFPAQPDMDDLPLQVAVRAQLADGSTVDETVMVTVRGPDDCVKADGERVRYRRGGAGAQSTDSSRSGSADGTAPVTVRVSTSPAPMDIWATGSGACPAGPTTLGVRVNVSAEVERVGGRLLVAGSSVASGAFVRGADGTWTGTLGPVAGRAGMEARTPLRLEVTAAAGGRSVSATVDGALVRPEACSTTTTTTGTASTSGSATTAGGPSASSPTTTAGQSGEAPAVSLSVATTPSPLAVWATRSGACPSGPTTTLVSARVSAPVERVGARLVVGGATAAQFTLVQQPDGSWSGTSPTIEARSGMDARTPLRLEVMASAGGRSVTSTVDGVLVEPERCASTTTATTTPTTAAPSTAPPTTVAPAATTTVATVPQSGTSALPPPPSITVSTTGSIEAVVSGACPAGATTLGVGVQVNVPVASITGTVTNALGQSATLSFSPAGGNRYNATIGPFNGTPQMPESSPLAVQVTVTDAQGRSAGGSATATLLRPPRCAG